MPVRIINFLSIDPPPSSFPMSQEPQGGNQHPSIIETYLAARVNHSQNSRPAISGLFDSFDQTSRALGSLAEVDDEYNTDLDDSSCLGYLPSDCDHSYFTSPDKPQHGDTPNESSFHEEAKDGQLGNLSMYDDDTDEIVQHAIACANIDTTYGENAPRFADLYYASVQDGLDDSANPPAHQPDNEGSEKKFPMDERGHHPTHDVLSTDPGERLGLRSNSRPPNAGTYGPRPNRSRGPSSFAARVQEKLEARGGSSEFLETRETKTEPFSANDSDRNTSYFCARNEDGNPSQQAQGSSATAYNQASELLPQNSGGSGPEYRSALAPGTFEQTHGPTGIGNQQPAITASTTTMVGSTFSISLQPVTRSRLLPQPPIPASIAGLPTVSLSPPSAVVSPASDIPAPLEAITEPAPAAIPPQPQPISTVPPSHVPALVHLALELQAKHSSESNHAYHGGDASGMFQRRPGTDIRPPLAPGGSSNAGSACSVKDKVRELEQRVRAEQEKGPE